MAPEQSRRTVRQPRDEAELVRLMPAFCLRETWRPGAVAHGRRFGAWGAVTTAYAVAMTNIKHANFEDRDAPAGFRARRARIGYELGSELVGASLWQLPSGEAAYPYHFHYADEEIVIVLEGRPSLRTPEGTRTMDEGETVRFAVGEQGAHQILNPTDKPVTFLAISSHGRPDIVVYPDSGKVSAAERRRDGSGLRQVFRADDAVDYWDGETPPDLT